MSNFCICVRNFFTAIFKDIKSRKIQFQFEKKNKASAAVSSEIKEAPESYLEHNIISIQRKYWK